MDAVNNWGKSPAQRPADTVNLTMVAKVASMAPTVSWTSDGSAACLPDRIVGEDA